MVDLVLIVLLGAFEEADPEFADLQIRRVDLKALRFGIGDGAGERYIGAP